MTLSGVAALEEWCRRGLEGSGVQVTNMTTSWRDGLAFCALVHRYRPDLLDLSGLDPRDARGNCALAFRLAEAELGIPALLDVEDMVDTAAPDRFSVLTYLAQFYHRLSGHDSGISSLSQSPASSASDELPSSGGGAIRRSNSFGRPRGAILSLMDGRRVRSRSLSAHGGRRGRLKSESFCVGSAAYNSNMPASSSCLSPPPVHGENPFKEPPKPEPVITSVRVTEKDVVGGQRQSADIAVVRRTVTLREKKRQAPPPPGPVSSAVPLAAQQRMAKSMILESDFDICHSIASTNSSLTSRDVTFAGCLPPRKAGSVLSFTSVPSPYRGASVVSSADPIGSSGSSRLSLLSLAYSSSRLAVSSPPTAGQAAPPVKPVRTFRHESAPPATATTTSIRPASQNTWDHYLRKDFNCCCFNCRCFL